ncbi:MAG TPA: hypothetical protein VLA49_11575 [Anaerolineales bacterium]|nr:hypothetical protein [Anaerolineales bacterium]
MSYTILDADKIIASLELLSRRIYERFPQSGLFQVSQQLLTFSRNAQEDSEWVARPIVLLRVVSVLLVLLLIIAVVWTLREMIKTEQVLNSLMDITLLEAEINVAILIGAGIFFLISAETRIKRRRALNSLHRLRVFAHIIDMHQLHKDPERVLERGELAPSTPKIDMTPFELSRYLDYCSEMLTLTGNIAGLYAQSSDDAVLVDAVSDIEQLTNGISRTIWQKLMILHSLEVKGQV